MNWMKHGVIYVLLMLSFLVACDKDKDGVEPSSENLITSFVFTGLSEDGSAIIDNENNTISLYLNEAISLRALKPEIAVSEGAELTPASGTVQDFSNNRKVQYLVKAESGKIRSYFASVNSYEAKITKVSFSEVQVLDQSISNNTILLKIPAGSGKQLTPEITISENCTVNPASGVKQDFSNPIKYTLTPNEGKGVPVDYTITVEEIQPEDNEAVRAVWIPAPGHTNTMANYDNISSFIDLVDELNMNAVYVCAWAQQKTAWPSQVLVDNSSYTSTDEGYWHKDYMGGSGDALADLISLAHKKNIKVLMWFEYGFMARWGSEPTTANDPLLKEHPEWVSKDNKGGFANYNGTDYYYNAYHDGLQEFMLKLIDEVLTNYNVDGIQGDDRMPAMPANSGYDDYTVDKYKKAHNGQEPPASYQDNAWFKWRIDILNAFAKKMYDRVKAKDTNCIVASAPNVFPWSKDNLMQDW
ncbi:MAG: family 10 glycosylhydrolase, partial [Carboxylicivirga sp.]|nr:family 10 glycosylhydrolase [Carboxylicivirga sp.]